MHMIVPGVRERRSVDRQLTDFFRTYGPRQFRSAIASISRFYRLRSPRVEWFEYLDWGKSGGRTFEDGKVALVHPENWKKGRKYNSMRQWIHTVHHEMGHYLFWANAERKADLFAAGMMRGIHAGNGKGTTRVRLTGTRRSVARRRAVPGRRASR